MTRRRPALTCLAATTAALVLAAGARADSLTSQVEVVPFTGIAFAVDIPSAQGPDVVDQPYSPEPGSAAGLTPVTVPAGYSLGALLRDAGVSSVAYSLLVVSINEQSVLVTSPQVTAGGSTPPVLWQSGGQVSFVDSAGDHLTGPAGGYVDLRLYPGTELSVTASTTTPEVKVGAPVKLMVTSVGGAQAGESLQYVWAQETGGQLGAGRSIMTRFYSPGTYEVNVEVLGSSGSVGFSPEIPIMVGKAPPGSRRKGGGTSAKRTSPDQGAGVKGSETSKASSGSAAAPATTTPAGGSAAPGATGATRAATNSGAHAGAPVPRAAPATGEPARSPAPQAAGRGALLATRDRHPTAAAAVSGLALSDPGEPSRAARSTARAGAVDPARTGHLIAHHADAGAENLWLVLGILAVLGVGAAAEARGRWWRAADTRPA